MIRQPISNYSTGDTDLWHHDRGTSSLSTSAVVSTSKTMASASQQEQPSTSSDTAALAGRVHCFTEQAPDAVIHFQIMDLGQQLYIWIAVGGAKLQNMYLAIQSRTVSRGWLQHRCPFIDASFLHATCRYDDHL